LLYNIREKKWDEKILDRFEIPSSILPEVQASASHFGTFNYKGHEIPITGVAGDQQAALFGQACFEKGQAKNTYGTGCWDMDARGSIYGLTRATTKAHIVKATLDGIAYQTKDVLEAMEKDSGQQLKVLKVDGGASQNNYLMQFQSDILESQVERPQNVETTAMGAAYLAGITLGLWTASDIRANRKVEKIFDPQKEGQKVNALYKRWQEAIKRSQGWKVDSKSETA